MTRKQQKRVAAHEALSVRSPRGDQPARAVCACGHVSRGEGVMGISSALHQHRQHQQEARDA